MYTKYIICTSEVFSQKYFSMRVSLKKLLTVSNSKYTDIYKNVMLLNMLEQKSVSYYFLKQSKQHLHLRSEFQLCRSLKEFRVTFVYICHLDTSRII